VSYQLQLSVINYQTAVLRGDVDAAAAILPKVPTEHRNRIAHFLDAQGKKEEALTVSLDNDHKFDLAIQVCATKRRKFTCVHVMMILTGTV
jgi:coatomer subunit beta'